MPFQSAQLSSEHLGRCTVGVDTCGDVLQDNREVFELLIEMTGEQVDGIFKLALVAAQRPLAKIVDHDRGADCDGSDHECSTDNEPPDGATGEKSLQVEGAGTICRHCDRCPGRNRAVPARRPAIDTSAVWR